jgi:uncharacterized protein YqgV (UPF0045/DUF77 family)
MCPLEKIISCQLSFIPIQSKNYLLDVEMVLDRIKDSGLEYNVGEMSTVIKGNKAKVLNLISDIYDMMSLQCSFVIDMRLSNVCGCNSESC